MSPREALEGFLARLPFQVSRLVVAISGGPDSMALLEAAGQLASGDLEVIAAHVNHGLREEESEDDEAYVRAHCDRIGIALQVVPAPPLQRDVRERGLEAAARSARYMALEEVRLRINADAVATAHHQNDQAETVLIRLITGLQPLTGASPVTQTRVIRPFLEISREDIQHFLASKGLEPRIDSSNANPRFLRNRVRNELLPLLSEYNPAIIQTLSGRGQIESERESELRELVTKLTSEAVTSSRDAAVIDLSRLPPLSEVRERVVMHEIRRLGSHSRNISLARLRGIMKQTTVGPVRSSLTRELTLELNGQVLTLQREPSRSSGFFYEMTTDSPTDLLEPEFRAEIRYKTSSGNPRNSDVFNQFFQVPDSGEGDPARDFAFRSRRPGDRFQPLGSRADMKLSHFLINRGIPRSDRARLPLLVWRDQIVWVAGVEISDRFKVQDENAAGFEVVLTRLTP